MVFELAALTVLKTVVHQGLEIWNFFKDMNFDANDYPRYLGILSITLRDLTQWLTTPVGIQAASDDEWATALMSGIQLCASYVSQINNVLSNMSKSKLRKPISYGWNHKDNHRRIEALKRQMDALLGLYQQKNMTSQQNALEHIVNSVDTLVISQNAQQVTLTVEELEEQLHEDVAWGRYTEVLRLIGDGVNPNCLRDGHTPLHVAVEHNLMDVVLLLLSQSRTELDAVTDQGETPLHIAAFFGRDDILRLLIFDKKADVHARDADSRTPLHRAAQTNNTGCAKLLLAANADPHALDLYRMSPLDLCREYRRVNATYSGIDSPAQRWLLQSLEKLEDGKTQARPNSKELPQATLMKRGVHQVAKKPSTSTSKHATGSQSHRKNHSHKETAAAPRRDDDRRAACQGSSHDVQAHRVAKVPVRGNPAFKFTEDELGLMVSFGGTPYFTTNIMNYCDVEENRYVYCSNRGDQIVFTSDVTVWDPDSSSWGYFNGRAYVPTAYVDAENNGESVPLARNKGKQRAV